VVLEDRRAAALGRRTVTAVPVVHQPDTSPTALRLVVGGRTVAYSGDAAWTEALVEVADGADLFISDCYAYDGSSPMHASYRTLLEQRPHLRSRLLALTHLGPAMVARLPEVRAELAADPTIVVAEDGMSLTL
jgi:ribonuclease BN (tRNA processing enzyme)